MSGAPPCLHAEGLAWQFDDRAGPGGPAAGLAVRDCRRLWLAPGSAQRIGPRQPGAALASRDGGGCEFGWEGQWLSYRFSMARWASLEPVRLGCLKRHDFFLFT